TGLAQMEGLDVVGAQRLQDAIRELGQSDATDAAAVKDRARTVGQRVGATAIVSGTVYKPAGTIRVDVQVEDASTGRLLAAHSAEGTDVFRLADDLTTRISGTLLGGDRSAAAKPVSAVTTNSPEAYRLYIEGIEARHNLRYADALPPLRKAVALDPSFASAYLELAILSQEVGDIPAAQEYRRQLQQHIDRLTDRERLIFTAREATDSDDRAKAEQILLQVIERYPTERSAYITLSQIYSLRNEHDRALEIQERGIKVMPNDGALRNQYAYGLLHAGKYVEAIREFEKYAELAPNEPNPLDSLGEAYLVTGQPLNAIDRYGKALALDPTFAGAHIGRGWAFGMLGQFDAALAEFDNHRAILIKQNLPIVVSDFMAAFMLSRAGRYREAESRLLPPTSPSPLIAVHNMMRALLAIEGGRPEIVSTGLGGQQLSDALSRLPAVIKPIATSNAFAVKAVAAARARAWHEAERELATLREVTKGREQSLTSWVPAIEGEMLLARGDLVGAERAFTASEPELKMPFNLAGPGPVMTQNRPTRDGLARVRMARGDLDGAIAIYRKLLTVDLSQKWTAVLEPRYVLQIARLLDKKGDKPAARLEYQRFLDFWKKADSDVPELAEARSRVAALR
ncbi:MAG TPA: hypothetical protein VFO52_05165, partial [Longimicrobiales bacterium]|nr:hypothetical protein [Longimicrobiales bacterium]